MRENMRRNSETIRHTGVGAALDREAGEIDREIAGFCAELGIAPPGR